MSEEFYKALEQEIYDCYCKFRERMKCPEIEWLEGFGIPQELEEKIGRAVSKAYVKVHMDRLEILEKKVEDLSKKFIIKCPEPGNMENAL